MRCVADGQMRDRRGRALRVDKNDGTYRDVVQRSCCHSSHFLSSQPLAADGEALKCDYV